MAGRQEVQVLDNLVLVPDDLVAQRQIDLQEVVQEPPQQVVQGAAAQRRLLLQ